MKLVASMIVHDEMKRYFPLVVDHLLEFCDEIRIVDDYSTDGTYEYAAGRDRVFVMSNDGLDFFKHEGQARNALLDWTLESGASHVLAIDADEFIADGLGLRRALEATPQQPVWTVQMREVWKADDEHLWCRRDGGWRAHDAPILWRVPGRASLGAEFRIADKQLSCGREPQAVRAQWRSAIKSGTEILHFGWTRESERRPRYERYVRHDAGQFHSNAHIKSIMWDDRRVALQRRLWPPSLPKDALLEKIRS